jgi:hypothetical protein
MSTKKDRLKSVNRKMNQKYILLQQGEQEIDRDQFSSVFFDHAV